MNMLLRRPLYTFDEFCALIPDGQKADLIDGVIYMASPDNTDAGEIGGWLYTLLAVYLQERDLGKVYCSRIAFRLDKRHGPEPDIGFVKKSRLRKVKRGFVAGPPDLAVEVVSPDSVERDYKKKRRMYEKFRVREYWIADEIKKKLTVLRLGKDGHYKQVPAKDGVFRSKVIPGFWLHEDWLWTSPLPNTLNTLQLLLKTDQ